MATAFSVMAGLSLLGGLYLLCRVLADSYKGLRKSSSKPYFQIAVVRIFRYWGCIITYRKQAKLRVPVKVAMLRLQLLYSFFYRLLNGLVGVIIAYFAGEL